MIKQSKEKVSLMTVRDSGTGSLSLAFTNEKEVSEVWLDMNQISIPDKIRFHKQASEVRYTDLTKEILAHSKSKQKVAKLEGQLKQEKDQNKDWSTQVKVLQIELAVMKEQVTSIQKPTVKVRAFKRRGKASDVDITLQPQTVQLQEENRTLELESIEMKAKATRLATEKSLWQSEREKIHKTFDEMKERGIHEVRSPTYQLIQDMSKFFLIDIEITQLKEKNQQLQDKLSQKISEDKHSE